MMIRGGVKVLSVLVVVCVLSVGGLAIGQSFAHDVEHQSHHQSSSHHGTVLCSWLCVAGQGWEVVSTLQSGEGVPSSPLESRVEVHFSFVHPTTFSSRAPPRI